MARPPLARAFPAGVAALFGLSAGLLCAGVLLLPMLAGHPPASGLSAYGAALLLLYGIQVGTRASLRVGPARLAARVGAGLAITVVAVGVVGVVLYALYRSGGTVDPARLALGRAGTLAFFGALFVGYGALRSLRAARRAQGATALTPDGRSSPRR